MYLLLVSGALLVGVNCLRKEFIVGFVSSIKLRGLDSPRGCG